MTSKVQDEAPRAAAPRATLSGGLGRPKRIVNEAGDELQQGFLKGHRIRCFASTASGEEVSHEADYSHVKVCVLQLRLDERHRDPSTGDYGLRMSKLEGEAISSVKALRLTIAGTEHTLAPQGGKLEVVLPKEQIPLPTAVQLYLEYKSVVKSFTATECDWFASDYEAKLDFGGLEPQGGCCVIS